MTRRLILIAALIVGLAAPAWAGFDEGKAAYDRGDYETALREWRPLAEQGDAKAQYWLGLMYGEGQGVSQDYAEAGRWYRLAAEQGNTSAQHKLRRMSQDLCLSAPQEARCFRKAAEQGDVYAQEMLGILYEDGVRVPQDYVEAVRWYRMAAERGLKDAQYSLGRMYSEVKGWPDDLVRAYMWFELSTAGATGWVLNRSQIKRDALAERMTEEQILEAQRLAREWKPKQ